MTCPKCGFASSSATSCERCGVIYQKLGRTPEVSKQERPGSGRHAVAAPPAAAPSFLNFILLTAALLAAAVVAWRTLQPRASSPQPPPRFDSTRLTSSTLPGRETGENTAPLVEAPLLPPEPPAFPDSDVSFPDFDASTVTPEVVEEVTRLAEENPSAPYALEWAGAAHLFMAGRLIDEAKYREALVYLQSAQAYKPDRRWLAWYAAVCHHRLREPQPAIESAQAALAFGPDAEMYSILGSAYYYREELSRAIEAWQDSLEIRDDPVVRRSLEKALAESRLHATLDDKRLAHFIVRYEGETLEDPGRLVLASLDRSWASLKLALGFEPNERIVVVLYTRQGYETLGGLHWPRAFFDGKVRLPVRGLSRVDARIESTLTHELTHAFLYAWMGSYDPRWLQEGLAVYMTGARSEADGQMIASALERDGRLLNCLANDDYGDERYFYPASTSAVEYFLAKRGMGGVRVLLAALADGQSIDTALKNLVGKDEMGFLEEWAHFMKRRYL